MVAKANELISHNIDSRLADRSRERDVEKSALRQIFLDVSTDLPFMGVRAGRPRALP